MSPRLRPDALNIALFDQLSINFLRFVSFARSPNFGIKRSKTAGSDR